jgi:hypothetical protein
VLVVVGAEVKEQDRVAGDSLDQLKNHHIPKLILLNLKKNLPKNLKVNRSIGRLPDIQWIKGRQ